MVEPEKPLKKKDQILIDKEIAQRLQEELQAELEEEKRQARQKEEDANIVECDNKLFDKAMTRVNMFVDMDTELVKESSKKAEMLDENVEVEVDDEAEMKKHMEIVLDDEVTIDAIPLATKPPIINIDREDLETLWKLVKAKHRNTRPEEAYKRVLWGDLKVMFEPDIECEVWRNLQGYKVTIWKLFSLSGVHFVRFQNLQIFMLVEKKYPLTPTTITKMLTKKLQADHWNEMFYQLLKLMTKQLKNLRSV
ncbi:hypothetical protein Tco_0763489 [Tanacetum coccineum]